MKTSSTVDFNIRASWYCINRMYNSYASEHDLTVPMAYVLLNIDKDKGTPSTQIAPMLAMEPSSLTRVLKNMEEKKLLRKETDEQDARQVNIFLTKQGLVKRELARKIVKNFNDIVKKNVPEKELEIFLKTLQTITAIAQENHSL